MYIDRVTLDIDVFFQVDHFLSFENEEKNFQVDSEQLSFDYWKQVNAKGGDFKLSYGGIKKDTKYWFNPIRLFFRQGWYCDIPQYDEKSKPGVSIIFKIRVFYKAWFEGLSFS